MKQKLLASAMALAMVLSLTPVTALAAEDEAIPETVPAVDVTATEEAAETTGITVSNGITVTDEGNYTVPAGTANATITISGAVTMTGTGDAFTINADTTLVFGDGASLTLSGYTNGFVVSNATLSGGGWVINDGDGMDLFKLNTGGKLNITGNVDLNGKDKTEATASRAIFLPWGTSGQAVTLGENVTLAANNFYRGMETGGASNYTISGAWMNSSEFDFSNNNCGMALSYFDSNARFEDCTLEVSNCTASGIFMRQDNAALDGLYITRVNINCVNPSSLEQEDIAIRFHSNNFTITDSIINIENARNTGLWIFDGWNANERNEITGTTITVKNVLEGSGSLYGAAVRKKAITFVPYRDWLIKDCVITMEGESNNQLDAGINIGNDMQIQRSGLTFTAKPNMYGGTIKLQDTTIETANISTADIGVQVGQFLEIGQNVVINNDYDAENGWSNSARYAVICDTVDAKFSAQILGITVNIDYNTSGMSEETKADKRVKTVGGSYYSDPSESITVFGKNVYDSSLPINASDDVLTMFTITPEAYETYVVNDVIELQDSDGHSYEYSAELACKDGNRYIWAPEVTVTFNYTDGTVESMAVPRGSAFGLTKIVPEGNWYTSENTEFTAETIITTNMTVTAQ